MEISPCILAGDGASLNLAGDDTPAARYLGRRYEHVVVVIREDPSGIARPLPSRLDSRYHSDTGFEWGYGGSGPARLALAILVDALGVEAALTHYQAFNRDIVARLPRDAWELSRDRVLTWIERRRAGP